jgi:chemotaxis regulatin CheY-phosphate phosphatase CheZ
MKKGALVKGNKRKLSRIDKIEKALHELIEEGKITSKRIREISEENEKGFRELRESINKTSERVDKVYELFDKTSERLDRAYELSERAFAAADRAFAAADRAFAAAERASQEVERTSKEVARVSEEVAKTSEEIRKLKTEISRLTGSWGEFVEGMIEPSAIKFMEQKGFKVVGVYPEAKVSRDGENSEYDLFLVCEKKSNNRKKDKVILLVSAKTKVSSRDVDELLEDMKKFFFFLEQYKGFKLMGAIAGIRFGKGADIYALRSGLIVMKPAGEIMQIQEPKKIRFVS